MGDFLRDGKTIADLAGVMRANNTGCRRPSKRSRVNVSGGAIFYEAG